MQASEIINNSLNDAPTVLHLGAGKVTKPFGKVGQFTVHVDGSYLGVESPEHMIIQAQGSHRQFTKVGVESMMQLEHFIGCDIFEFMDTYCYKFNLIVANRIFEHMFYDAGEIGRLLSACHYMLEDGGELLIMVPNHELIATRLFEIRENITPTPEWFSSATLLVNTEFCNTRCDPHGSIWSPRLARYYIRSEGVWHVKDIEPQVIWDDRDCYMMIKLNKLRG